MTKNTQINFAYIHLFKDRSWTAWVQILGFATYKLCDLGKLLNFSTVAQ